MEINPGNTAIRRNKPSRPTKFLFLKKIKEFSLPSSKLWVFDYGCGRRDDIEWLGKKGYSVMGWDPNFVSVPKPTDRQFDIVLCNYVVCVTPDKEERKQILSDAWSFVKPGGLLFASARPRQELNKQAAQKGWTPYLDGWITSHARKTFQHGYTTQELISLVRTLDPRSIDYIEYPNKEEPKDFIWVIIRREHK